MELAALSAFRLGEQRAAVTVSQNFASRTNRGTGLISFTIRPAFMVPPPLRKLR